MEKKLIGLYVPAVQERFDLLVPVDMDIAVLTKLLVDGVEEICAGRYTPSHQEMLSRRHPDILLHPGKKLADYGVENGAQLVLI